MNDPTNADATAPTAGHLEEVASRVYAWVQPDGTWFINNAGAVASDVAMLVVDTCATEERTSRFLAALSSAESDVPMRWAVNTHQHGDHTYGNSLLPPETTLLGHANMREGLLVDPVIDQCPPFWEPLPVWGAVERRVPDVAVQDSATVFVGQRRVELKHPGGPAHTTGDLVAWVPEERVLFAGDLIFARTTPLIFMGSLDGALAAIDWLARFRPDVIVPGHGPVLRGGEIDNVLEEHRSYYRYVQAAAQAGLDRNASPLEVADRLDLGVFAEWTDSERIVLNLHRAYADAAGRDFDPASVLPDAIRWLGHPMTTHV